MHHTGSMDFNSFLQTGSILTLRPKQWLIKSSVDKLLKTLFVVVYTSLLFSFNTLFEMRKSLDLNIIYNFIDIILTFYLKSLPDYFVHLRSTTDSLRSATLCPSV